MEQEDINIVFVLPSLCKSASEVSAPMNEAFILCQDNLINCKWCNEQDCLSYEFSKKDFFIFQEFNGTTFNTIKESKSVILGPWCLLTCLTEGKKIPNFPWPIYSVAMMDCTVSFSSLAKQEKKELQEKVEYMGGYVSASLMESCTHLVTNSVKSEKYIKAAESGKNIMLSSWITDVWEASLKSNIHATNETFSKHKCPVLYNLIVCCTGLSLTQRNELQQLITDHGGTYKEQLHVHKTDIVITENATQSAKYKAAKKYNIKCVTVKWAVDSVKNGYAMPDNLYQIQIGTSTPTKDGMELPNFSMISNIANATEIGVRNGLEVSETVIDNVETSKLSSTLKSLKRKSNTNEHNELVDEINLKEVKNAGPFLDGCGIYLVGFGTEQREKLCKILNSSGATRYNDISERVTHVVVGDESCMELKLLRARPIISSRPIVSIHWLLASLQQESPVDEERFIIGTVPSGSNGPSSPLSKKSLHLLQEAPDPIASKDTPTPTRIALPEVDIVQQYLHPNASNQEDTLAKLLQDNKFVSKQSDTLSMQQSHYASNTERPSSLSSAIDDDSSQLPDPIYEGLKFIINDFIPEQRKTLKMAIESMAGTVVPKTYKKISDYAVVPAFSSNLKQVASDIVNDLWISECWQENEIRPIKYYHQPISVNKDTAPLKDCVVTISSYTNYERSFLKNLIVELGGICQELLSRIDNKDDLKVSTHLVTPDATGKKYMAAIKWGLPVLNKDWLLESARSSKYALETPFLIGTAKRKGFNYTMCMLKLPTINLLNKERIAILLILASMRSDLNTNDTSLNKRMPETPAVYKKLVSLNQTILSKRTPKDSQNVNVHKQNETPPNKHSCDSADQTPLTNKWKNIGSQITPVQKIIAEARRQNLLKTPDQSLPLPLPWDHVDTPETPLGAFIHPNPSPNLRKQMVRFLNSFPDHKPRRDSTPLSELKRKLWDKICPPKNYNIPLQPDFDSPDENVFRSQENLENVFSTPNNKISVPDGIINTELKEFQEMLTASGGKISEKKKNSILQPSGVVSGTDSNTQPNTVTWDGYTSELQQQKVFMLSSIELEKRVILIQQIESLGGKVSNSLHFDPESTHLICSKPSRNEKILASMSAGIWILHESYVNQCIFEGHFVDEELFEFGNPKFSTDIPVQDDIDVKNRLPAIYFWRQEISRRCYGAFHDMRLIVMSHKRDPLIRVLQAGGGMVIDESPPFTKPVHATHCLIDLKAIRDIADYVPLAKEGIFCVNTLFVNDFLLKPGCNVHDFIIPYLQEYYESI
ncbi:hypothetical protein FQA39_LY07650 [Lamprigera yunnana]|nr:hypothetical protein FQA39_LY07650 [Lamprigera yunnana]